MSQEDVAVATVPEDVITDADETKTGQETSSSAWNAVFSSRN